MMMNTQNSQNTTYYGFQVYVWAKSQSSITGQFVDPCLWLTNTSPLFSAPTTDKLKFGGDKFCREYLRSQTNFQRARAYTHPFAPTENESTREILMIGKILKHSWHILLTLTKITVFLIQKMCASMRLFGNLARLNTTVQSISAEW